MEEEYSPFSGTAKTVFQSYRPIEVSELFFKLWNAQIFFSYLIYLFKIQFKWPIQFQTAISNIR